MSRLLLALLFSFTALIAVADEFFANSCRKFAILDAPDSTSFSISNHSAAPIFSTLRTPAITGDFYLNTHISNLHASTRTKYIVDASLSSDRYVKSPQWGIRIFSPSGNTDILLSVKESSDPIYGPPVYLSVSARLDGKEIVSRQLSSGVSLTEKPNVFILSRDSDSSPAIRLGDSDNLNSIPLQHLAAAHIDSIAFLALPGAALAIHDVTLRTPAAPLYENQFVSIDKLLDEIATSPDPLVGVYELYEFDIDQEKNIIPDLLRVIIVPDSANAGAYSAIYLSGYPESSAWRPGMFKARLTPSPFQNYYYLHWVTESGSELSKGASAVTSSPALIEIQFPFRNVRFSLRRIPDPSTLFIHE